MQRLQRSLIRIVKGPTGGFLASLGIAAVLGGVALATPSPPIAAVTAHHSDVIVAAPLGSSPTPTRAAASAVATPSGGVQTDADPTGRGPAMGPIEHVHGSPQPSNGNGRRSSDGGDSPGGMRSAGASPAHQDARDDPPAAGGPAHKHHGSGGNHGDGQHGSGSGSGSGEHDGDKGSGSESGSGSGSGGPGSGDSGGSGSAGSGNSGSGGSGSGSGDRGAGSGGSGGNGNSANTHLIRP